MAVNTEPVFVDGALTIAANTQIGNTILPADTTDAKDIVAGATDGTVIQDIVAVSDDTSAVVLKILVHDGTTAWLIGTVNVPTLSGTDGAAASVSLLNVSSIPSLNKRDDGALLLASGQKLQVSAVETVTADKTVTLTALGGNL